MAETFTYEKVLDLIMETNKLSSERLEKELRESRKEFEERLRKEAEEREKSKKEFEDELRKSRKDFDKKIGEITGTLGRFVEGLVEPRLKELFIERGIPLREIHKNIIIFNAENQKEAEIDILLVNKKYSLAVEVKTTLTVEDVNNHLKRLDKLQEYPIKTILNTKLLGAVAGMKIEQDADRYAYRKGLFVLKQKGEIVEIANDNKFQPREWNIE